MHGAHNAEQIGPDGYNSDQAFLDRPGNEAVQLDLFFDYQSNLRLYPEWQAYLRKNQPRTLIVWGKNDPFFTVAGAEAFSKHLDNPEIYLVDAGHFALEEAHEKIAALIGAFIGRPRSHNGEVVWAIARIQAVPGRESELKSAVETVVAATREEPGSLTFDPYQSAADPAQLFVHESWRSVADLHNHFETPHVAELKVKLATLAIGPIELTQLEPLMNSQFTKAEVHAQTTR